MLLLKWQMGALSSFQSSVLAVGLPEALTLITFLGFQTCLRGGGGRVERSRRWEVGGSCRRTRLLSAHCWKLVKITCLPTCPSYLTSGFLTLTFPPFTDNAYAHTHTFNSHPENCFQLTSAIAFLNRSNIWYCNRSVSKKKKTKGLTRSWRKVWCYSTSVFFFYFWSSTDR